MTELQMGLIGLGGATVVGVLVYNKWQEMRHRKLAEQVLRQPETDVLLGGEVRAAAPRSEPVLAPDLAPAADLRQEPGLHGSEPLHRSPPDEDDLPWDDSPLAPIGQAAGFAAEPSVSPPAESPEINHEAAVAPAPVDLAPAAAEAVMAAPPPIEPSPAAEDVRPGTPPASLLDGRLEFIVAMELVDPVPAAQILHSQREIIQRITKPVHWVGFNERTREWERLTPESDGRLRSLRVGLQLVNRLGPVSDADLALFAGAMQSLADELMAVAEMPSTRIQEHALELDRFCAAVDLEIGVNLVSRGPAFSGTKIRALAEAAGMVLGVDGLFTRYDDDGRALFSLQNFESTQFSAESIRNMATHGLTFLLDVPRVDHGERVFSQMIELAKRFAETLQGALVDDNRAPLGETQLEHIRREFVGKPQATMAQFNIPAGSPQALRLFS